MYNWLKQNQLIFQIIAAVFLGWLTPEWGARGGYLHSEVLIKVGVIFIFFTQGFSLSTRAMIDGLRFWPLHLYVQSWIFLIIPVFAVLAGIAFSSLLPEGLLLGLFFLAALPTTVSSAVALVGQAGGNSAGAVFNTVLSNLAAVFILPVWLLWYQSSMTPVAFEIWPVFWKLVQLLLVPFFIGHASQYFLKRWKQPIQKFAKPTNQWIIVFMVYTAFATSFRDKVWESVGPSISINGFACALILLFVISVLVWASGRVLFSNPAHRIAAFFTASQKSLAVGVPYSATFFANLDGGVDGSLQHSIVLLPLLFYHPLQLLLASVLLRFKVALFGATKSH
jgi:sodium/bile acid cotransporter 7